MTTRDPQMNNKQQLGAIGLDFRTKMAARIALWPSVEILQPGGLLPLLHFPAAVQKVKLHI
jgi:hypothetical protein